MRGPLPALKEARLLRFALLAALLLVPAAAAYYVPAPWSGSTGDDVVRPGSFITAPDVCTVGFLFASTHPDDTSRYASSAGHCFTKVGEVVEMNGTRIGTVAWRHGDEDVNHKPDFALIRLDPDVPANPSMKTWGGPCPGTYAPALGDVVAMYGNGASTGETFGGPEAQENARTGILTYFDARRFGSDLVIAVGDSGAPVVHRDSRLAIGLVEQYGAFAPQTGPRLPWIEATLAAEGVQVTIAHDPSC